MKTSSEEISRCLNLFYCGTAVEEIRRVLQSEYGRGPAKRTVFNWIEKYSGLAAEAGRGCTPANIGDTWIADETIIRIGGQKVWIFDIQDEKTRFLLFTQITLCGRHRRPGFSTTGLSNSRQDSRNSYYGQLHFLPDRH